MTLIILAGGMSILVSLLGTPLLIRRLKAHGYAQAIRESSPDAQYPEHEAKLGTPSMGGAAIIMAILVGYFGTHVVFWTPPSMSGVLALWLILGLGAVGVVDDYMKIFRQRSTGIRARSKLIGQAFVAITFAIMAVQFPDDRGLTPASQAVSIVRDTELVLPMVLFVLWIWFLVTATTNGVNLTKLESYQKGASFSATMFFADIIGRPGDPPVDLALEELAFYSKEMRLLGSYPLARERG